jgi:type I restriction enzyme S subunit
LEPFTNSAELGVVEQKDFFDHDVASKVNLANYYVVAKNDFVYNPRISTSAPVGPISRNKMDKYGLMSPLYTVFRPVSIVPLYLEQYFKSSHWYRFMKLNGNTGARSDRFAIKDTVFFEMPIPLPNTAEQLKIGRILELVDNILVLHQRE